SPSPSPSPPCPGGGGLEAFFSTRRPRELEPSPPPRLRGEGWGEGPSLWALSPIPLLFPAGFLALLGDEGAGLPVLLGALQDQLHGLLDLGQLAVAEASERHALLEQLELLLQPELLRLDLGHDRLESRERFLEALLPAGTDAHSFSSAGPSKSDGAGPVS